VSTLQTEPVRLSVADAGEILTLQRAAYVTEAQCHDDIMMPPLTQSLDQLRSELADAGCIAWGIREAGRLIASLRVTLIDELTAEFRRAVVAPDRQGQGLGTALLQAAEDRLPGEVTTVRLFTGAHSAANLRLYRRLGFQVTGRTPAGRYDLVHLAKARSPSPA
jgi:ribosomal protein S18 acetylase RimI-like enzyme